MSSAVAQKRGRPKKVEAVDMLSVGKEVAPPKTAKKVDTKASTKTTTKPTSQSTIPKATSAKPKLKTVAPVQSPIEKKPKPATATTTVTPTTPPSASPKSTKSDLIENSKILQELAILDAAALHTKPPDAPKKVESVKTVATIIETIQAATPLAPILPPTPIPSQQASTPPIMAPFLYAHNPNASILQRTAYMSTKSNPAEAPPKAIPRKPQFSPKAINAFVVNEQASRGGPGSGAEHSRAELAKAEAPSRPGDLPKKYKPALRRYVNIIFHRVWKEQS
jgi:hypothetical protein